MSGKAIAGMVVLAVFLAVLSETAPAQQGYGSGPGPAMMREDAGRAPAPEQFSEIKARVLKMIDERRTRLDREKACVEAATNDEELKKCRPGRPMRPGGGMQGDPGQQRPSRPGGEQRQ